MCIRDRAGSTLMIRAAGLPREARLRRAGDFAALRHTSGRFGGRCFSVTE
ncbi:hypothetical protein [Dyella sp. ASV21]|nr:hypothetical protein [Dyella sp. ASV21]